mmetsp:Transcript_29658/g.59612  ORF Transcript_29658/g.59612 Transcript_29658/m.59612 type:complete len:126 (+) Transcript_29658:610-987(+)
MAAKVIFVWIAQISQTVLVAEAYAKNALVRNAAYVGIFFATIAEMKYGLVVIVVRRLFVVTVQRDRIGLNVMNAWTTSVTIAMRRKAQTQYGFVMIVRRATVVDVGFMLCAKKMREKRIALNVSN